MFLHPPLFCKPVLWWWCLSPLHCHLTFTPKEGNYWFTTPTHVLGWVGPYTANFIFTFHTRDKSHVLVYQPQDEKYLDFSRWEPWDVIQKHLWRKLEQPKGTVTRFSPHMYGCRKGDSSEDFCVQLTPWTSVACFLLGCPWWRRIWRCPSGTRRGRRWRRQNKVLETLILLNRDWPLWGLARTHVTRISEIAILFCDL